MIDEVNVTCLRVIQEIECTNVKDIIVSMHYRNHLLISLCFSGTLQNFKEEEEARRVRIVNFLQNLYGEKNSTHATTINACIKEEMNLQHA